MNECLSLLAARRSVPPHSTSGPPPSPDEIETLLTLASRVPDHGKLAPWRFLVIDEAAGRRLGEVIASAFASDEPGAAAERLAQERGRLTRAPLVIAVVSGAKPHAKIPDWEQVLSAGAVCMNLIVAANAMGLRTAWLTEWFAYDRRILDAMGLAPHERMAGFVHIGHAAETPPDRPRPVLADVVTYL